MAVIPHRYPFLLIDRILHMDAGAQRLVGLKNISGNEPYMAAPALPFTPGYLQVEMAAQAGCALALSIPANHGKLGFFMAIDEARFHAPVLPGDQLLLDTASEMRAKFGKGEAKLYVGDQLVSEVLMKFAIVDREAPAGGAA
ncbi:MAG: 3-hydroxyacyl-[acyl-carrier-protein] dehydratase FabZ [Lentisphaeria bacterium]